MGKWSVIISAAAFALTVNSALANTTLQKQPEAVPGEMIVKLKGEPNRLSAFRADTYMVQTLSRVLGENAVAEVKPLQTDARFRKIKLTESSQTTMALQSLRETGAIEYAEPNFIYRAFDDGAPNDTDFAKLWGMRNTGQTDAAGQVGRAGVDINILPLWKKGIVGSRDVVVAVIDTGVDYTHPDLQSNIWRNEAEAKGTAGADDDGNGFIDDVYGWDFANNKANGLDDHSHGTHCSGTIGGDGNNGMGVAGVNWKVSIMPTKFLSSSGSGSLEGAVNAIKYATKMGAKIMSNSWGGGGYSQALYDAINEAGQKGILFVAAAGNETNDNDTKPTYPATYQLPNVLSVAAVDNQGKKASFSNWGAKNVHVAAPGVKIYSTVIGGKYDTYSGTSMACPHVSGIAALLWSTDPNLTYADIKKRLIETSQPIATLKKVSVSKGMVNVANAFNGFIPPSDEPDPALWKNVKKALESDHPYTNKKVYTYTVSHPGAKFVRVTFEKIDTESGYDVVTVETPNGEVVEQLSGQKNNYTTEYVSGDTLIIHLKADEDTPGWGFKVSSYDYIAK